LFVFFKRFTQNRHAHFPYLEEFPEGLYYCLRAKWFNSDLKVIS